MSQLFELAAGSVVGRDHARSLMKIRISAVANAELAFSPDYDVAEKVARLQFP